MLLGDSFAGFWPIFSLSDLDCQSLLARCKARGESLARSLQSGLQIALGSRKALVGFGPCDLDCRDRIALCEEGLAGSLGSRLQIRRAVLVAGGDLVHE